MTQLREDTDDPEHDNDLSFGDVVIDNERPDSKRQNENVTDTDTRTRKPVVVNVPPVTAEEWDVPDRGVTVAEDNPQYRSDSPIAIVVFTPDLDSAFQYYSGVAPLKLTRLERSGVDYYAFPQPRLQKAGSRGPITVDIDRIYPSPYHSRTFSLDQNTRFVEKVAAREKPPRPPLVWANHDRAHSRSCTCTCTQTDSLTLLDGHKRVWASHVAGLEDIEILGMYLDDETATRVWANRHLDSYNRTETNRARTRLKDKWGEGYRQFF
ncbi:hypothetical protein [Haloquadratum walsbyi]|uniref:Uncharacterized protein n=1 Tax=Haloquadratum walsbyi J07HQW2 TaxID=1238425 RepID=U1PJL1_9EURY|nr:hypothetical protein [Haloquadratum walsbyi]ERG93847.1 MAG: hypothetical protein J07HQW2_00281 [Haloquadratum walsbyi J07HQW2]